MISPLKELRDGILPLSELLFSHLVDNYDLDDISLKE